MKTQARIFAVLLAAAATQSAFAGDGQINFTGELTDSTCVITVNGQVAPALATVALPKLSTTLLKTAGNTAGKTGFNIELSACTGTTTTAAAFFEAGSGVNPLTSNLFNTGGAKNVELQLVDVTNGAVIKAGDQSQVKSTSAIKKNAAGSTILPYAVQYISTGVAGAGLVAGTVTYSINYQ
jgi:major type 1 subunit fimbrin (pilin)